VKMLARNTRSGHAQSVHTRSVTAVFWRLLALFFLIGPFALFPGAAQAGTVSASDNFARANGSLGPNWTDMSVGGLAIANDEVAGTNGGGNSGDIRTAESYDNDQYSAVQVTSTPLSGNQWVGPAVRAQDGGQDLYVGIYYWNGGSPELMLFLLNNGGWSELGSAYPTSPLAAGTELTLTAVGSSLDFAENGTVVVSASNSTLTGGAPGIMANGLATAGDWSGGDDDPSFSVSGTVSGLSGTVVLQDNGNDNLSVSANGSFTFATLLTNGAAYNVSVLTNPAGQACSVSGGSGTVTAANVTGVSVTCVAEASGGGGSGSGSSGQLASDNFDRPNGSLGPEWTNMSMGGLAIANDEVTGTSAGGNSGDIRTGEAYGSNQYSTVQVTSTPLTGTQWIGPTVRAQDGGQDLYVGIYYWNNGSPALMLFLLNNGSWSELGAAATSALTAGTQLTLTAVASTLDFAENGTVVVSATDSTLTGGAPGIMANGTATAGNWAGGDAAASGSGGSTTGGTTSGGSITGGSTTTTSPSGTYSVGGTVSGLSGTLVLQDNGDDNLSVSANGSFTFATLLANGAGYNVSVATDPTGQNCSVSNGSGTVAAANVSGISVTCVTASTDPSTGTVTDNFVRANGSLGPDWTNMSMGGLAIANDEVTGTNAAGNSGDIRTGETYDNDQFSAVQVTSTPLSGSQWIGPAVRAQDGGQDLYVGIYYWNNGSPELMLFMLDNGSWSELGAASTGPLAAGTELTLTAVGSTLDFAENGTVLVSASNSTLTGGAPGIMANGTATAGDWSGGDADPIYSVSGTISGLSGTVVLEDNDNDNLSVSANGVFTFATLLANGAPYNVSVLTNPTGQSCSVTNGSGTVAGANASGISVACVAAATSSPSGPVTDNFGRPNGGLGPDWTNMSVGGLAIANDEVTGTNSGGDSGDIRTGESYGSDQYSQIEVTSTPLSGTQWIGPAVRAQAGGQDLYVGFYYWNNGSPELMLFLRDNGNWSELAGSSTSPLAAGTQLTLTVVGNTLDFAENGTTVLSATDNTLTGGAPAIMASGTATAADWSGGNSGFQVAYQGTANGIETYSVLSPEDGYGIQTLRVLQPTQPAAGVAHNFLFVLPVEAGLGNSFGDGLATLQALDAEDQYNLTIVEPTFTYDPWYANNPSDPALQYETFLTTELVPWVDQNLATTGTEQNWLIGFSKSGYGAQDLLLKYPNLFAVAATWDFPADMSSYSQYGATAAFDYGTEANFAQNYQLSQAFVAARAAPFITQNRIWLGGYSLYSTDVTDYSALLTSQGIKYTMGPWQDVAHRWDSGWMPAAVAALYQDSLSLPPGP